MTGMKKHGRPEASGFYPEPGKHETDADHHHGKTTERIPGRGAAVVICKNQDRVVPDRPDNASEKGGLFVTETFVQFGR